MRALHVGAQPLEPGAQILGIAVADVAQDGHEQPFARIDGDAEMNVLEHAPAERVAVEPSVQRGLRFAARRDRADQPQHELARVAGHHAFRSASSLTVTGATSACACAMLRAIVRRTPRSGSSGPSSRKIRATRSTSRTVTVSFGPLGVTTARSTSSRRASARTAGVAFTAVRAVRPRSLFRA